MKKILFILAFLSLTITSCTVIQTTHSFYHHGTDAVTTNSNFKYVKTNVVGRSSTVYYPNKLRRDQGVVREGLVADAKKNLSLQHPLSNNQAYANLTIDILNTSKGTATSYGVISDEITIEAVISADIIEYID